MPEELIAQHPLEGRDESRLLVCSKQSNEIEHKIFKDIRSYLKAGDCLVLNDTRVLPARLLGRRKGTDGKMEFLLLKKIENTTWEVMVKPGKRAKIGAEFVFGENEELTAIVKDILPDNGTRVVEFFFEGIWEEILDKVGIMPLPPYITEQLEEKERYQTVYSQHNGSAAAPTAGLHFTNKLLKEIKEQGVNIVFVTLHVGIGTFRPVKEEDILKHKMHSEYYTVTNKTAEVINETKKNGNKVYAVGTTSVRTLETVADENGEVVAGTDATSIFIYPGYQFKVVDGLITNFHLPKSTLLMLVSALLGREKTLEIYDEAVRESYRFFSFGDAMFIH